MEPIQVRLRDCISRLGVDLLIFRRLPGDKVEIFYEDRVETKNYRDDIKPSFYLTEDMLLGLADALQARGVRPKEAGKTEGLYEAQTKHLEDMRKLVFDDIEKVKDIFNEKEK